MRYLLLSIGLLFLTGCSIDIEETSPVVQKVFLKEKSSLNNIVCTLDGSYPHITNLSSVQVEININATMDAFADALKENIRNCPTLLTKNTEEGTKTIDSTTVDYTVTLLNEDFYSVSLLTSQMLEGAAHPQNSIDTFVFDIHTGQPISLKDYFSNTPNYKQQLENAVVLAMKEEGIDIDSTLRNPIEKFYLTEQYLVLTDLFDVFTLKGFEVKIPFTDIKKQNT